MTAIQWPLKRRRNNSRNSVNTILVGVAVTFLPLYFVMISWQYGILDSMDQNTRNADNFVPTLRHKKILIEVTTVGQSQYIYLERALDSFRDLCEAGAKVSLHITTTNCDPDPKPGDPECPLYGQSSEETRENNYPVEKIDQLNERMRCRDPDGSLDVNIRLISPEWGKQVVDNHRRIFYDGINDGYDVFVHSEEDETIRPTNILAFMHEMDKLRRLVGKERIADYSIGFIRYEDQMSRQDKRRVVWEFDWEDEVENTIDHPGIEGRYFTTPKYHHQGMFMATREQLLAWKTRGPNCKFDKPIRRPGYHRERTSGAMDLYDDEYCNVTQLLPLDSMEDLYIHHMPDKNYKRLPDRIFTTMDLHKRRMKVLLKNNKAKRLWVDRYGRYNGIKMFIDERNKTLSLPFDLTAYQKYVKRGGMLSEEELVEWEWKE